MVLSLHHAAGVRAVLMILLLVAAVGGAVVHALPAEEAQAEPTRVTRSQEIRSVSLDGRNLPLAALRDVLATRAGDLIDLPTLARDRQVLLDTLVARGYLSARVDEPRVTFGAGGAVFVTFAIEQGPLFRIRAVRVTGATDVDAGVVSLGVGEIAEASRITLARAALEERLRVRRQTSAVDARLVPDVGAGLVDIELVVAR